ncbi:MAG: PrgI family protein [Patescibacteria group bacterium]|nr:PrgI family protein [Patescibacteria group bacterium]
MQFKVPQFIDIEDKLFGPFSFKQFAYLAGGGGLIFILYKVLPFPVAIILIIPVGALTAALVFYKINDQPFIYYLQAGLGYIFKSKLYLWKQRLLKKEEIEKDKSLPNIPTVSTIPKVTSSKLKDLSWSLDVENKSNG